MQAERKPRTAHRRHALPMGEHGEGGRERRARANTETRRGRETQRKRDGERSAGGSTVRMRESREREEGFCGAIGSNSFVAFV